MKIITDFFNSFEPLARFAEKHLAPLADLAVRLYVAQVFLLSGWLKLQTYFNGTWSSTVWLFAEEYKVPVIPAELAAWLGTGGELVLGALLALGLLSRFAALGLIAMTLIIELTYIHADAHIVWLIMLAVTLTRGGGSLALDRLLAGGKKG